MEEEAELSPATRTTCSQVSVCGVNVRKRVRWSVLVLRRDGASTSLTGGWRREGEWVSGERGSRRAGWSAAGLWNADLWTCHRVSERRQRRRRPGARLRCPARSATGSSGVTGSRAREEGKKKQFPGEKSRNVSRSTWASNVLIKVVQHAFFFLPQKKSAEIQIKILDLKPSSSLFWVPLFHLALWRRSTGSNILWYKKKENWGEKT